MYTRLVLVQLSQDTCQGKIQDFHLGGGGGGGAGIQGPLNPTVNLA